MRRRVTIDGGQDSGDKISWTSRYRSGEVEIEGDIRGGDDALIVQQKYAPPLLAVSHEDTSLGPRSDLGGMVRIAHIRGYAKRAEVTHVRGLTESDRVW